MKVLIEKELLERIDSLLCNLQNEQRPINGLRKKVREAMENKNGYAIRGKGDVAFSYVRKEFSRLGYKPISESCHISRVGYNVIGVIAGNWLSWSESFWEDRGYEIIDSAEFLLDPEKYILKSK